MSNQTINPLNIIASAPAISKSGSKNSGSGSWFEAMAEAWGDTLDKTAGNVEAMATDISNGNDTPGAATALSTETLRLGFLSNSAHTSISSAATALETMVRKQ